MISNQILNQFFDSKLLVQHAAKNLDDDITSQHLAGVYVVVDSERAVIMATDATRLAWHVQPGAPIGSDKIVGFIPTDERGLEDVKLYETLQKITQWTEIKTKMVYHRDELTKMANKTYAQSDDRDLPTIPIVSLLGLEIQVRYIVDFCTATELLPGTVGEVIECRQVMTPKGQPVLKLSAESLNEIIMPMNMSKS